MDEKRKEGQALSLGRQAMPSLWPNDLISRFFGDHFLGEFSPGIGLKVDVRETDTAYVIEAELPGMDKSDISLSIDGDLLTISGKKEENKEEKDENGRFLRRERRSGSFQRSFMLENVDTQGIKADLKDGVLTIDCPKKEPLPPSSRTIAIE